MARRSQCSNAGDNPLDPNYLPPHYREEYRLAIDALVEEDLDGYYQFLQKADVVDFLASSEIQYIQDSIQLPQQSNHPEQRFLETSGDGSSDTYWPIHSDLDAPGLDLGWPQLHHFIGPTEVTTLVNPPEPDMPSIKEQARRLIKNAQQVIAVAMDMFTDVDILHDILSAAMRNVAVYILLDEQNAHHFVNMVSNCRVNLQSIQFLRVRTVSGITYHCRSGKSFQGQMMDRFLLTDCRAVLSGNYSFMWSFEKLNRCMAHLFLGQLVSTFDEEFRILYAQSEPLMIENALNPMDNYSLLQKRPYATERTSRYGEPRKFQSSDRGPVEDWARQSYDERMDTDWRMMPLKKKEPMHGPADIYSRPSLQQPRMDQFFDQGPSRMTDAFKRHSYAEGTPAKYSYPFMPQQGMPEPENQGRPFHRGQQPYPGPGLRPGKEPDYSGYDKFWNQDYHSSDQYSEPGLPQEMEPPDNFDPVLNYLSSTRNTDFDQGSENLPPAADVPFSSSHPRRLSLGQPYACQTSPTPSNPTEQKQFFLEPNPDRKDPLVKRGLRDWRISSYLSAYENPEDEGLPFEPPNAPDAFEEPSNIMQHTMAGIDLTVPKIPNVREFKVPAIPRASQMPSYAKTTAREQPKKLPDEPGAKTTPTPSESSSTTEGEKTEEPEQKEARSVEQKEPRSGLHREESFRRKYNPAVQRSSRLRSSLIFSSLEQQHGSQDTKTSPDQQDEEGEKNETEQTKQPFVQVFGQRRSTGRGPYEWSRFMKSATFDGAATDSPDDSKADDKDSSKQEKSKDPSENPESTKAQESLKTSDVEKATSPSMPQSKSSEADMPKTDQPAQPPKSLLTNPPFVDMSDPDARLMFFKELAAKRKAAKAAEAEKSKEKLPVKAPTDLKNNTTLQKEQSAPQETAERKTDTTASEGAPAKNAPADDQEKAVSSEASKSATSSLDTSDKTIKAHSQVKNDPTSNQSSKGEQTKVSTDSDVIPPQELKLPNPAVEKSSVSHPSTPTSATPADVPSLAQGTNKNKTPKCLETTSNKSSSLTPSSLPSPSTSAPSTTPAETVSSKVSRQDSSSTSSSLSQPQESSQKSSVSSISQTASQAAKARLDSVSKLTSSETPSPVDPAPVDSDISLDKCAAGSEPKTSSLLSSTKTDSCSEKAAPQAKKDSVPQMIGDKSSTLGSPKDVRVDGKPPESGLPNLTDLESKSSSDQNETVVPAASPEVPPQGHTDLTPKASQSETSPQDASVHVTRPSVLNLTGPVTPPPAGTPLTKSGGSVLSPEAGKTLSALPSPSNATSDPESVTADSNKTPMCPTAEMSGPAEPTSKVPPESNLPCETPESVTSETHPSEPTVPAENSDKDSEEVESQELEMPDPGEKKRDDTETTNEINETTAQESACSEKANDQVRQNNCSDLPESTSDEARPQSPQSKQPKSTQSRYQSSTANVLSSSNLRDDTKLLLEQISANSQNRNETTKESPVTDDEKEDEADKSAKRETERGIKSLSRGRPVKSNQEREMLLERIQSMRKERKVYSRFEMAP